jgi:hypothetical protein
MLATSCTHFDEGLAKDIDDLVTDEVVCVKVDKAAMQKDTDVEISVKITNKEPPTTPVINIHPPS